MSQFDGRPSVLPAASNLSSPTFDLAASATSAAISKSSIDTLGTNLTSYDACNLSQDFVADSSHQAHDSIMLDHHDPWTAPENMEDAALDLAIDEVSMVDTFSNTLYTLNKDTEWPNLTPMFSPFASLPSRHSSGQPASGLGGQTTDSSSDATPLPLFDLHRVFFEEVSCSMPFISRHRFESELLSTPSTPSLNALSYGIALLGALTSSGSLESREQCYIGARDHIEVCERSNEGEQLISLNAFQALLLITRYEILGKQLTRAYMTLGRAIHLSRILDLQNVDRPLAAPTLSGFLTGLAPSDDQVELEERRRSFWYLLTLESYITNRAGLPTQLGPFEVRNQALSPQELFQLAFADTLKFKTFNVYLPSCGELVPGLITSKTSVANLSSTQAPQALSPFACSTLMVRIAVRCFAHHAGRNHDFGNKGFWDRHYELVKSVNECLLVSMPHATAKAVREDPLAFSTHINLHAIDIILHDTAIHQVQKQDLPTDLAAASEKKCSEAAVKIAGTIRLVKNARTPEKDMLKAQSVCLAWPIVMAVRSLGRDLSSGRAVAPSQAAEHMQLLLDTLEYVEGSHHFWETYANEMTALLQKWNENQSGLHSEA